MALDSSKFPDLGTGVGLRSKYYDKIFRPDFLSRKRRSPIQWFEVIVENFYGLKGCGRGKPFEYLSKVREHFPVAFHGVSLSIGSTDELDYEHLKRVRDLMEEIKPSWFSDHLCWTGVGGKNSHDLLPLSYNKQTLAWVVDRIKKVQDFMGRQILLENVSSYVEFKSSEMSEWEFLSEVAESADCGVLLDINNIYVSSFNHGYNPELYLKAIPQERVGQMHVAGHSKYKDYIIDTHDNSISDPVWKLLKTALKKYHGISIMIERDDRYPPFEKLEEELEIIKDLKRAKPRFAQASASI